MTAPSDDLGPKCWWSHIKHSWYAAGLEDITTDTSDFAPSSEFRRERDPLEQLRVFAQSVGDQKVAQQTQDLLILFKEMIRVLERERADIKPVPPLHAHGMDDGSVLIEWRFPEFRIGFNVEPNPDESGWHILSSKRLGNFTASAQLSNKPEIVVLLLRFILRNT